MLTQLFIFSVALFLVMRGATIATKYSGLIAASFRLSQYTVGFIVVAVISILPETFIALNAALEGIPEFGFGMILGSNVADLTLIIALITFFARRTLHVESKILKSHALYPFLLLIPIVLGLDGYLSRTEGGALIIAGIIFYYLTLRHAHSNQNMPTEKKADRLKDVLFVILGIALLLIGAHFTVSSASTIASLLGVNPILIGMLVVGLGTTIPELFFSLKAVRHNHDALAIGDILGTVLADATIVIGVLALIAPFSFPTTIIYVAGVFMVSAAFILFSFMRSGKVITSKEAFALFIFWITFILIECIINL